jgi:DNA helicase II / ATP-dependent DNA helicase PcrA
MLLTPEQIKIISAAKETSSSLFIAARAGCGKTFTVSQLFKELRGSTLAVAFNKKNAEDLEKALPGATCKTFDALGLQALRSTYSIKFPVKTSKTYFGLRDFEKKHNLRFDEEETQQIVSLINKAYSSGLVPSDIKLLASNSLVPDTLPFWHEMAENAEPGMASTHVSIAREIFTALIKQTMSGTISFSDMSYSAVMSTRYPQFDNLIVDEAQDISPLNHFQIKLCRPKRIIVTGDERQACYSFRGADSDSMRTLRSLPFPWTDLTLSTTFRCPSSVVVRQQHIVPGYTAAATNPEGEVTFLTELSFASLPRPLTILCRNNKPLISLAFSLLSQSIPVKILGRDIGENLKNLSKRIIKNPKQSWLAQLDSYFSIKKSKAEHGKLQYLEDQCESLRIIIDNFNESNLSPTIENFHTFIQSLFSDKTQLITLSTIHKFKGLESENILLLKPSLIPSKYAVTEKELDQEKNLRYIAETRTRNKLFFYDGEI